MTELIDNYVEKNILQKHGVWYYHENKPIAKTTNVKAKLLEMIESGLLPDLRIPEPGITSAPEENVTSAIEENATSATEEPNTTTQDERNEPELTVPLKPFNPALRKGPDIPEFSDDLFAPLAANVGDISTRQQGGRFRTYVFGIDSRLKDHPSVKNCPYVFRHNDKKRNVRSGTTIYNEGWTVLSKKLIKADPRTGKAWLTVSRDDTPDEDFFTVGNAVLCYADKKQFNDKKSKMDRSNEIRAGVMSDKRQENAQAMASISKNDPAGSMIGYLNSNKAEQVVAKEQLTASGFSRESAENYIARMNNIGNKDQIENDVDRLQHELNQHDVRSMRVSPLSL